MTGSWAAVGVGSFGLPEGQVLEELWEVAIGACCGASLDLFHRLKQGVLVHCRVACLR